MDDLEARLKGLPLRAPSPELDRRILDALASPMNRPGGNGVPWWAAAAVALGIGLGGFFVGRGFPSHKVDAPMRATAFAIEIVDRNSPNAFDFTQSRRTFPEEVEVFVQTRG